MDLHYYFRDFNKYLGFRHERKTPLNPQANAEAEQFMRVLKKLYTITITIITIISVYHTSE